MLYGNTAWDSAWAAYVGSRENRLLSIYLVRLEGVFLRVASLSSVILIIINKKHDELFFVSRVIASERKHSISGSSQVGEGKSDCFRFLFDYSLFITPYFYR